MAKMKKFDIMTVPVEVEYKKPLRGRIAGVVAWFMLVRFRRFNVMFGRERLFSFYRLIVPRYVSGGGGVENG